MAMTDAEFITDALTEGEKKFMVHMGYACTPSSRAYQNRLANKLRSLIPLGRLSPARCIGRGAQTQADRHQVCHI